MQQLDQLDANAGIPSLVLVSSSESSPWRKALYSSVSAAESRMFLRPRGGLPGRAAGDGTCKWIQLMLWIHSQRWGWDGWLNYHLKRLSFHSCMVEDHTAVLSEAWAKLREWAILAGKGWLLLSGSVVLASLKASVLIALRASYHLSVSGFVINLLHLVLRPRNLPRVNVISASRMKLPWKHCPLYDEDSTKSQD